MFNAGCLRKNSLRDKLQHVQITETFNRLFLKLIMAEEMHLYCVRSENESSSNHISIHRPFWSEQQFTQTFPIVKEERESFYQLVKRKICFQCNKQTVCRFIPIIDWLSTYSLYRDGLADLTGGITVGIMHIPQGLAFAMLASLPPVTGLYTALVPVFLYMVLGTSRYLSQGSFAVICLMVAQVIEREVQQHIPNTTITTTNNSSTTPLGLWNPHDSQKIEIAISLALLVGLIQVAMGVARLGFLAAYLSDPVISGFTTGSAVLVVVSQLQHVLGLNFPQTKGLFAVIKTGVSIVENISSTNLGSLVTASICLAALLTVKYLNKRFQKKLCIPIPGELLVVVIGTMVSYWGSLALKYGVQVLGTIPKGLPPISIPSWSLMTNIVTDAFVISIVIFATNISLAKIFAKKNKQTLDPNQELIAYGICNVGSSFFTGFPICNALARTAVQENIAHTQLCSVVVIVLILLVLMFMTRLFYHLPKAVLAAVIIANLTGLLRQFNQVKHLWGICRTDSIVWLVTCFGVILLGVAMGLGCGVLVSVLFILFVSSRPKHTILGSVPNTEIYRDIKECQTAKEVEDIKILRYESPLYYGNIEHFRNVIETLVTTSRCHYQSTSQRQVLSYDNPIASQECQQESQDNCSVNQNIKIDKDGPKLKSIIIDASTFTHIDSMGVLGLDLISKEYQRRGIQICLANCSSHLRTKFMNIKYGFHHGTMFVSIHDAVVSCQQQGDRDAQHEKEGGCHGNAGKDCEAGNALWEAMDLRL